MSHQHSTVLNPPPGWRLHFDNNGRPYYFNPVTSQTTWAVPVQDPMMASYIVNPLSNSMFANPNFMVQQNTLGPLPPGWDEAFDNKGRKYFIDHNSKTTSWDDPRLKPNKMSQSVHSVPTQPIEVPKPYSTINPNNNISPQNTMHSPPPTTRSPEPYVQPMYAANNSTNVNNEYWVANQPSGGEIKLYHSKAAWNTSLEVPACCQCASEFGFWKRKHTCTCCMQSYCATCCSKTGKIVKYGLPTNGKVCDSCYTHLHDEDPNCIRRLVPCLVDPKPNLQRQAISEIYELLTSDSKYSKGLVTTSFMNHLLPSVSNGDQFMTLFGVRILAKLVEIPENVSFMLANNNTIPLFIKFLKEANDDLMLEAARGLSYMADNSESFPLFIASGGIPVLISSLIRSTEDFRQWVSLIILKLSYNDVCCQKIHESFGIPAIISLLTSDNFAIMEYATGALIQFVKYDVIQQSIFEAGGIAILVSLINRKNYSENAKCVANAINCLYIFIGTADLNDTYAEAVISSSIVPNLLEVLGPATETDTIRILLIFNNLITSKYYKKVVTDLLGGLSLLVDLLKTDNSDIRGQVLALFLAMSSDPEVKVLIRETPGFSVILNALPSAIDSNKSRILQIIRNLCKGDDANIEFILSAGVNNIISSATSENTLIQIPALEAIDLLTTHRNAIKAIMGTNLIQILIANLSILRENTLGLSLKILDNLSKFQQSRDAILEYGGVHYIISHLNSPFMHVKESALQLLVEFSNDPRMSNLAIQTNCIVNLLGFIMHENNSNVIELASLALLNLAKESRDIRELIHQLNGEVTIISLLYIKNTNIKNVAIEVLAYYSTEPHTRNEIVGCSRILLQLVYDPSISQNEVILVNIVTTLSNLSVDAENAISIMNNGGIQSLLYLLQSEFESVRANTVLAIGNMARTPHCREALLQNGVVEKIALLCMSASDSIKPKCIYTLHMLSYAPRSGEVLLNPTYRKCLTDILHFVISDPKSPSTDALLTILNLSQFNAEIWKIFVELGGIPMLLVLASSNTPSVQKKAADELGKLTLQAEQTKLIFQLNGIETLVSMLSSPDVQVQESILTAIANLSSNKTSWKPIIESGGISTVLSFLSPQDNYQTQLSSTQIIANISSSEENLLLFEDSEVISRLIDVLANAITEKQQQLVHNVNQSLSNLVAYHKNTEIIYSYSSGIAPFFSLLSSDDDAFKIAGASAILHLSRQNSIRKAIMNDVDFSSSLNLILASQNVAIQQLAVDIISSLKEEADFASILLSGNSLSLLISLLKDISQLNNVNIVLMSIEIVTVFEEIRKVVLQTDIINLLMNIISSHNSGNNMKILSSSNNSNIVDVHHCFNIIANLAIEEQCRALFTEEKILKTILNSLSNAKQLLHHSLFRAIVLMVYRLCLNGNIRNFFKQNDITVIILQYLSNTLDDISPIETCLSILDLLILDSSGREQFIAANGISVILTVGNRNNDNVNITLKILYMLQQLISSNVSNLPNDKAVIQYLSSILEQKDQVLFVMSIRNLEVLAMHEPNRQIIRKELVRVNVSQLLTTANFQSIAPYAQSFLSSIM